MDVPLHVLEVFAIHTLKSTFHTIAVDFGLVLVEDDYEGVCVSK